MNARNDQPRFRYRVARQDEQMEQGFESFDAVSLYCPKCKTAMPVKKKLLLILPGGDLYNLVCTRCGESLGKKEE